MEDVGLEEEEGRSEFGRGIVVCLAKFSEHLRCQMAQYVYATKQWIDMPEEKRYSLEAAARAYPNGDAARMLANTGVAKIHMEVSGKGWESALSHCMEMAMNGASDHFYDLDDKAPESLKELASLTLKMGHGYTDVTWTWEDWERIEELWKESCLAVDKMLGVENPDFGKW